VVAARSEMFRAQQEFENRRLGNGTIKIERMMSQLDIRISILPTDETEQVLRIVGVPTQCRGTSDPRYQKPHICEFGTSSNKGETVASLSELRLGNTEIGVMYPRSVLVVLNKHPWFTVHTAPIYVTVENVSASSIW
jgi:hypothetical protein